MWILSKLFQLIRFLGGIHTAYKIFYWLLYLGGVTIVVNYTKVFFYGVINNVYLLVLFSTIAVLIFTAVFLFISWFLMGNESGINTPRYLNWYKFPFRKLSWDFDNCLSLSSKEGKNIKAAQFQVGIRVNRGDGVKPKKAIIKSLNKGSEMELKIETDPHYKPAHNLIAGVS